MEIDWSKPKSHRDLNVLIAELLRRSKEGVRDGKLMVIKALPSTAELAEQIKACPYLVAQCVNDFRREDLLQPTQDGRHKIDVNGLIGCYQFNSRTAYRDLIGELIAMAGQGVCEGDFMIVDGFPTQEELARRVFATRKRIHLILHELDEKELVVKTPDKQRRLIDVKGLHRHQEQLKLEKIESQRLRDWLIRKLISLGQPTLQSNGSAIIESRPTNSELAREYGTARKGAVFMEIVGLNREGLLRWQGLEGFWIDIDGLTKLLEKPT